MTLFFMMFGVICTSFFKGKHFVCEGTTIGSYTDKWECMSMGGDWGKRPFTFDSIPESVITLFVMSTTAGWSQHVVLTLAAGEID